jgi:hypothetical protein
VRWSETTPVEADLIALDAHLSGVGRVSLIKADIEGAELPAFRGAKGIIERDRPTVICEINPWFLDGFGIKLSELVSFFADRGYALYRYEENVRRLVPVGSLAEIVEDNYVFVHPDRTERLSGLLGAGPSVAGAPRA